MNRDDAVARLRAGLSALRNAEVRAIAFAALEILAEEPDAPEDLIQQAREDLIAAVPELEPVIAFALLRQATGS